MRSIPSSARQRGPVIAIGLAQLVAWASSTYLPAVTAQSVAAELGIAPATVFGAFSLALLVMAACGPAVGAAIDHHGGRGVLCSSNLVLAGGLVLLGASSSTTMLFVAWAVLGFGMALGLYDAAFSVLVRLYGTGARGPITGVTLLGGFASTVGWPLTAWLVTQWDWRIACFGWAAVHLVLVLPLHAFGIPKMALPTEESVRVASSSTQTLMREGARGDHRFLLLTLFGATTAFVTSAMAAHLPGFLLAAGAGSATALLASALLGPAQVAARLSEFLIAHRFRVPPLISARVATAMHPAAGIGLAVLGGTPVAAIGFAVLHGAGNGLITIAKGTLPLVLFGPTGYGARQGVLAVSQRVLQAAAPFVFALVLEMLGVGAAIALSVTLSLLGLGALLLLQDSDHQARQ